MSAITMHKLTALFFGTSLIAATGLAAEAAQKEEAGAHMWADILAIIDSDEHEFAVTPVGRNRLLFTRRNDAEVIIMETVRDPEGGWTIPAPVSFAVTDDADPFYDPYNSVLYYMSRAPHSSKEEGATDYDIWQVELEGNNWGTPTPLGGGVNTSAQEVYPTTDREGVLYFASNREGGYGGHDIYIAKPTEDGGWQSENAGPVINTEQSDSNPLILPDGETLLFYSGRNGGYGEVDLYRALGGPGGWHEPVNLGPTINSADGDYAPSFLDAGTFVYSQGEKLVALPLARVLP